MKVNILLILSTVTIFLGIVSLYNGYYKNNPSGICNPQNQIDQENCSNYISNLQVQNSIACNNQIFIGFSNIAIGIVCIIGFYIQSKNENN
jgi:hypothetical protein